MTKRFIVALNLSEKEQDFKFIEFLNKKKLAWWHWIDSFWLVVDYSGELNAEKLHDKIMKIYLRENLVIELRGKDHTWYGFGHNGKEYIMFEWLEKNCSS